MEVWLNNIKKDEIDTLNRLVVIFLEAAELRVKGRKDITFSFWQNNVDRILELNDRAVLSSKGKISHKKMEERAREIYEQFDDKRKAFDAQQADETDLHELREIESKLSRR